MEEKKRNWLLSFPSDGFKRRESWNGRDFGEVRENENLSILMLFILYQLPDVKRFHFGDVYGSFEAACDVLKVIVGNGVGKKFSRNLENFHAEFFPYTIEFF